MGLGLGEPLGRTGQPFGLRAALGLALGVQLGHDPVVGVGTGVTAAA